MVTCQEGNKQTKKERNGQTIQPLLTKHIEFEECISPLSQHRTVGLANDPLVVMLRSEIQRKKTAH